MSEQEVFNALKYRIEVDDDDGSRHYYNTNGELHRTDGPAVEWSNGAKFWYHNDRLHRTDGPAVDHISKPSWCESRYDQTVGAVQCKGRG